MNLEKIVHFKSLVKGLVLGTALMLPYAISNPVYSVEPSARESKENDPMKSIGNCLLVASNKALEVVGVQGGYTYTKPAERHDLENIFIPYYYDRGKILMPETKAIEKELSDYVDRNFLVALKLHDQVRFIPEGSKIKTAVKIKKGVVEFKYDISLLVSRNDMMETRFKMDTPAIALKSKLYEMLEIARFITDSHKEDPNMIAISTLVDMGKERGLRIQSLGFDDLPDCTFYKITKHKQGEGYTQLGGMSDHAKEEEKIEKDETGEPEVFQFFNRYPKKNKAPKPEEPSEDPLKFKISKKQCATPH